MRTLWRHLLIALGSAALACNAHAGSQTRTAAFEYNAAGLLAKEIIEPGDPNLCLVTVYEYDSFGNKTSATTRNCNGSSSEAAAPAGDAVFETRTSTTDYSNVLDGVTYGWNPGQFATSTTNALGHREKRTFDSRFGAVATLTGPNQITTNWVYDVFGRKIAETRADTTASAWTYTFCTPGACPNNGVYFVTVTSTGAPTSKTYYDRLNRVLRTETQGFDGTLIRKDTDYDARGRVARVSKPYYVGQPVNWTTFTTYDDLDRAVVVTEPPTPAGTLTTTNEYDGLTTRVRVNSNPEQIKTTVRNSQGLVVQVIDTDLKTVSSTYDEVGNLKTTTDALGNVVTLDYDARGRKIRTADPDMGAWQYAYNALSELVRQTDAKGQQSAMVYDKLGRMKQRTEGDLVSKWFYDCYPDGTCPGVPLAPEWNPSLLTGLSGNCAKGIGKLCYASADNSYRRLLTYDSLGRPKELNALIDTSNTVTTIYVLTGIHAGKVDAITYPTGFGVRNVYNGFGYLSEVRVANPSGSSAFAVDGTLLWRANIVAAAGQVTNESLGAYMTQTRGYDALDRLNSVVASGPAGTAENLAYGYDVIGNVTTRADGVNSVNESFTYDRINRLKMVSGTGPSGAALATRGFDYDAIGNMIYKSDVGTYSYPPSGATSVRPHAVSGVSGPVNAAYAYDANGNLTSGGGRAITYKSFNQPAIIQGAAATYTYTYSPEHERVRLVTQLATSSQTSIYVHPGGAGSLLYEKEIGSSATEHKHYVQAGAGLVGVYVTKSAYPPGETKQMRYYHRDHLGSIVAISNETGGPLESLGYEAYGKRRYSNGTADPSCGIIGLTTDRGFTAHEHLDELCLVHMNGRIYDPLLGRFMTADPTIQAPGNLQSYNRYSYVWNNPLGATDPTGYSRWTSFRNWSEKASAVYYGTQLAAAYVVASFYVGGPVGAAQATYTLWNAWNAYKHRGASAQEAIKGVAISAATSAAMWSVGVSTDAPGFENYAANVAGHAAVGCASSAASGGTCGSGAAAGALGAAASPLGVDPISGFMVATVAGGVGSKLTGGDFADGAKLGAVGYLFNYMAPTHTAETFRNARVAGASLMESLSLAVDVASVDFRPGSQSKENAHMHAMCTRDSTTCVQDYDKYLAKQWRANTREGLVLYLHAIQDMPAHQMGDYGGPRDGALNPIHLWRDGFPAVNSEARRMLESGTLDAIRGYRAKCPSCF